MRRCAASLEEPDLLRLHVISAVRTTRTSAGVSITRSLTLAKTSLGTAIEWT